MNRYRLNGIMEERFVWEAEDEQMATREYLHQCLGIDSTEEYVEWCKDFNINPNLVWTQVMS